ncbi:MAG: hypothetical protein HY000_39730 [Planctomycetes bacterium]|nr:hypothetical protein [Planctomycetota bacterium]
MSAYEPGDMALATWANDGFLYPAVIVDVDEDTAHVAFLDGDEGKVPIDELFRGEFEPGMSVSVNFKGGGLYYVGRILSRIGMAVEIDYKDGDYGWATIAQCRMERSEAYRALGIPP